MLRESTTDRQLSQLSPLTYGRCLTLGSCCSLQLLRHQTSEDVQLEATIAAVAGGPQRDRIFLTFVNKAAAEHHLPWFLRSLRALQVCPELAAKQWLQEVCSDC